MPQKKFSPKLKKAFEAEQVVAQSLKNQGWHILSHNFRIVGAELDIVALKGSTLAIVEVKSRLKKPSTLAEAETLFSPRKRAAMERGSLAFISKFNLKPATIRFDLAIVWGPTPHYAIEYVVNAQ
jgi:putative endonuclease